MSSARSQSVLVCADAGCVCFAQRVIRWPVLLLIVLFMSTELAFYFSVRFCVYLLERFVFLTKSRKSVRKLQQRMAEAETYDEWKEAAEEADRVLGSAPWKAQPHSVGWHAEPQAQAAAALRRLFSTG